MRRFLRILLNAATALSLLLCLAAAVLWVRSYIREDHFGVFHLRHYTGGAVEHRRGIFSGSGRLCWASGTILPPGAPTDIAIPGKEWRIAPGRRPSDEEVRRGWFTGDFGFWNAERDETFELGFGHNHSGLISPAPQWNDLHWWAYAVPHWYVALALLTLPACRFAGRRLQWDAARHTVAATIGYAGVAVYGLLAMPMIPGVATWLLPVPAAAVAAIPLVDAVRLLRRARRPVGHCPACGYDLRASPDRCPECGTAKGTI